MRPTATSKPQNSRHATVGNRLLIVAFQTPWGAVGVVESPKGVVAIRIGFASIEAVCQDLDQAFTGRWVEHSPLADRMEAYMTGDRDSFEDVVLDTSAVTSGKWTAFRSAVTTACRKVPYGAVSSYAELAAAVGQPKATRAVGSVMKRNCWPIVVPCHRILSAGGGLGGFTSPRGLDMKRDLLSLEQQGAARPGRYS